METIKITTSQNIDIDYEVAGLGERIVARLIDFGIFILILIAIGVIGAINGGFVSRQNVLGYVVIGLYIAWLASLIFYDLFCEVFLNGQSVGKRIMKIKVISLDGARPNLGQYFIRWLFRIVDFLLTFQLGALIAVIVTKNKQRIGDLAAGTTLISTKQRANATALAFAPAAANYEPVFEEVKQLSDRDLVLIYEVMQSQNQVLVHQMANQIKLHLKITTKLADFDFLETVVKDYNFMMAKLE